MIYCFIKLVMRHLYIYFLWGNYAVITSDLPMSSLHKIFINRRYHPFVFDLWPPVCQNHRPCSCPHYIEYLQTGEYHPFVFDLWPPSVPQPQTCSCPHYIAYLQTGEYHPCAFDLWPPVCWNHRLCSCPHYIEYHPFVFDLWPPVCWNHRPCSCPHYIEYYPFVFDLWPPVCHDHGQADVVAARPVAPAPGDAGDGGQHLGPRAQRRGGGD